MKGRLVSEYKKMSHEINKILNANKLPEEIQQKCNKLKLPKKMLKMCNLMESKFLIVEMEIVKNTPKDNYYEEHLFEDSHVDFLNIKYKNVKVFVTTGLDQLKEFLAKNEMLAMIPSKPKGMSKPSINTNEPEM